MSYCCTLLWNIIALWCVNKAGACCRSICSQAGQTGTTSRGGGGEGAEQKEVQGSGEQHKHLFYSSGELINFAVKSLRLSLCVKKPPFCFCRGSIGQICCRWNLLKRGFKTITSVTETLSESAWESKQQKSVGKLRLALWAHWYGNLVSNCRLKGAGWDAGQLI